MSASDRSSLLDPASSANLNQSHSGKLWLSREQLIVSSGWAARGPFITLAKSVQKYTLEVDNILRYILLWLYYARY